MSGIEWEEIIDHVRRRRESRSLILQRMSDVRDRYNGDYIVPVPGTGDDVPLPPLTPSIIADAIDNTAMRAASVDPIIHVPALEMGKAKGIRSTEYADKRRGAIAYTWHESRRPLLVRRMYRHLAAYATTSIELVPDLSCDQPIPKIRIRDPLMTYPEPKAAEDHEPIANCAYVFGKSAGWIEKHYPGVIGKMRGTRQASGYSNQSLQEMWNLVTWNDANDTVIGLVAPSAWQQEGAHNPLGYDVPTLELQRFPNRAGVCTSIVLNRVTLDRIASQMANMVGQVDLMGRIMALQLRGVEKGIWPDTYIIGDPNRTPILVGGRWKEGTTGEVNLLQDVNSIGQLHNQPEQQASQIIDRMERNARISTGTGYDPSLNGENTGSLRTGRALGQMDAAAIDPRIQELQEIAVIAMEQINRTAFCMYEGYWPKRKYTAFSFNSAAATTVEFTPEVHLAETHLNLVAYPIPGADVQSTTVILGQLFGSQAISLATFRHMHPYVDDPQSEQAQRLVEDMEQAVFASLAQRFSSGGVPPVDQASLLDKVSKGVSLVDAIKQVDAEAQKRQATQAPAMPPPGQPQIGPDGQPVPGTDQMASPPEAMPGLANPNEGAAQQMPTEGVIGPSDNLNGFRDLTKALVGPQRQAR